MKPFKYPFSRLSKRWRAAVFVLSIVITKVITMLIDKFGSR